MAVEEERPHMIGSLFDVDTETEVEGNARVSLIELVSLYDRFLEFKKLSEEIFEEEEK